MALRRIKPQRTGTALHRRPDSSLNFVDGQNVAGREILLDSCVYIDVLTGKMPVAVKRLLQARLINHSTIALSELTHLFGALDPTHTGTKDILRVIGETIDEMPAQRISAPSVRASGEAGMLAGLVARLRGQKNDKALLNDALLFLQAAEMGCDLLTGNIADFDCFDQLLSGNGLLLYRC